MLTVKFLHKTLVSGLGEPTLFIQQGENTHGLGGWGGGEGEREREKERISHTHTQLQHCTLPVASKITRVTIIIIIRDNCVHVYIL